MQVPNDQWCWVSFYVLVGQLLSSLEKHLFKSLPIFELGCFFVIECFKVLHIFLMLNLLQIYDVQIFSPIHELPFYSVDSILGCINFLNFMKSNLSIFCYLCLWCYVQEVMSNIVQCCTMKLLSYVSFQEFYYFGSYI